MQRDKSACAKRYIAEALESRRLLSAGGLDTSFGKGGIASTNFSPLSASGRAMAVQSDGKVVEVASASDGNIGLVRFNANGTLDPTFGNGGRLVTRYGNSTQPLVAYTVALQTDGKILVGASPQDGNNGSLQGSSLDIVRFNTDGTPDKSFGQGGFFHLDVGDDLSSIAIAVQKDGRIVAAGEILTGLVTKDLDLVVVRVSSSGVLDGTFGQLQPPRGGFRFRSGIRQFDVADGRDDLVSGITLDYSGTPSTNPNYGSVLIVGNQFSFYDSSFNDRAYIARLTSSGDLATSFNGNGIVTFSVPHEDTGFRCVAVEDSGEIIAGGSAAPDNILMAFTPTGKRDATFAGTGILDIPSSANSIINGFANRLIVGGSGGLLAYSLSGVRDLHFAGSSVSHLYQIAAGPSRTIVAGVGGNFTAARFFDIGPSVAVGFDNTASEQGPTPTQFIVSRDQRLPFSTRVFFSVGGTATAPTAPALKNHTNDYTVSGMVFPAFAVLGQPFAPYVDIPANQTNVFITFTPVDDAIPEGLEAATFTIMPNALYDIGTPPKTTIEITDNGSRSRHI